MTVTFLCNYTLTFIALFINRYWNRFLPLLWQFVLIPNTVDKFMDLRTKCINSCFCWVLPVVYSFNFPIAISTSKKLILSFRGTTVIIVLARENMEHFSRKIEFWGTCVKKISQTVTMHRMISFGWTWASFQWWCTFRHNVTVKEDLQWLRNPFMPSLAEEVLTIKQ
jgi:hypothetical protein